MRVLVTGAAGFIGCETSLALLSRGDEVIGVDNHNDYYDVNLKEARFERLSKFNNYNHIRANIADLEALEEVFREFKPDAVINLAAQAGVRYSIKNPHAYVESNLVGFVNILECCRHFNVGHLVYASSSSVYGSNEKLPFAVTDSVDHPVSLYAATKKSNELLAHTYSHLYKLPTTGLRFFTVYGPWGRPDMACYKFTDKIMAGEPIDVYNYGKCRRDFTFIDDIVEGVVRTTDNPPEPQPDLDIEQVTPANSRAPFRVFNIGNHTPVELMYFIEVLEGHLGQAAEKNLMPLQPGDVKETHADVQALMSIVDYKPNTTIEEGLRRFVAWYKEYNKVS